MVLIGICIGDMVLQAKQCGTMHQIGAQKKHRTSMDSVPANKCCCYKLGELNAQDRLHL